jgi:hypothetical protein
MNTSLAKYICIIHHIRTTGKNKDAAEPLRTKEPVLVFTVFVFGFSFGHQDKRAKILYISTKKENDLLP